MSNFDSNNSMFHWVIYIGVALFVAIGFCAVVGLESIGIFFAILLSFCVAWMLAYGVLTSFFSDWEDNSYYIVATIIAVLICSNILYVWLTK